MIEVKEDIAQLMVEFREIVRKELRDQGHVATGKLANTMRIEVQESQSRVVANLWLEDYFLNIEYPLQAGRVPYTRGSGARFSQLVESLMRWFRQKGVSNPSRATFATINKWKKEGRPTRASFRFSRNGRRTGFMKESVKTFSKDLGDEVIDIYASKIRGRYIALFRSLDQFNLKAS
jgi:hypothetical protein